MIENIIQQTWYNTSCPNDTRLVIFKLEHGDEKE
jgi:hypothetical protein